MVSRDRARDFLYILVLFFFALFDEQFIHHCLQFIHHCSQRHNESPTSDNQRNNNKPTTDTHTDKKRGPLNKKLTKNESPHRER